MKLNIVKMALIALIPFCLLGKANAGLIVGDLYADTDGVMWEYVGSYDLSDGRSYHDGVIPFNGLEAAAYIFGLLNDGQEYALSSNLIISFPNVEDFIVNHKAWYDAFDNPNLGVHDTDENAQANNAGGLNYDALGDISAYIRDRAVSGEYINHVFKTHVQVPESSSLSFLALGVIGLMLRRRV